MSGFRLSNQAPKQANQAPNPAALSPSVRLAAKWLLTLVLLGGVFYWLDAQALADQVQQLYLWPALLALALSVLQVLASAWRWRYTAARLGLPLGFAKAVREYYLGTFLNQVLPGGVAGDASRAWRHGSQQLARGAALRAVMIERFSGQVVLLIVAVASISAMPALLGRLQPVVGENLEWSWAWTLGLVAVPFGLGLAAIKRFAPGSLGIFATDLKRALFSWPAFAWQWLSSVLVLATYLAVFLLSARALGLDRDAAELLPLVPLVLLAMVLPLSVAGWGLREGAAALVWAGAGLPPEEGVMIAVTYGVLVLVASLPGAVILARLSLKKPAASKKRVRSAAVVEG